MSFMTAFFYDRFMANIEEACIREWRHELLGQVSGEVLEIGAGTGANINHYSDRVTKLVLTEPDEYMRKRLMPQVNSHDLRNIHVMGGKAEIIEADDETFDYVVASLVCCSVADPNAVFREIKRVLKQGGGLVFLEHVAAAEGTSRRCWQNIINPLWRTLMGNCHLNRETEQAILTAGFKIIQIERESMRKAPPIVQPTIRGVARKT